MSVSPAPESCSSWARPQMVWQLSHRQHQAVRCTQLSLEVGRPFSLVNASISLREEDVLFCDQLSAAATLLLCQAGLPELISDLILMRHSSFSWVFLASYPPNYSSAHLLSALCQFLEEGSWSHLRSPPSYLPNIALVLLVPAFKQRWRVVLWTWASAAEGLTLPCRCHLDHSEKQLRVAPSLAIVLSSLLFLLLFVIIKSRGIF